MIERILSGVLALVMLASTTLAISALALAMAAGDFFATAIAAGAVALGFAAVTFFARDALRPPLRGGRGAGRRPIPRGGDVPPTETQHGSGR